MPIANDTPSKLRPFLFHGLDLTWREGAEEALGDCPFCGREGKFSVHIQSGQWRCFVCNEGDDKGEATQGGNIYVLLRMLYERWANYAVRGDLHRLAENRKLRAESIAAWGLVQGATMEWVVPGYAPDGRLMTLYIYRRMGGRMALMPTPELGHHLFGVNLYDAAKPTVYLTEGLWDAIALWEALGSAKAVGNSLAATSNKDVSLLGQANVLGIPAAMVFFESWLPMFAGKHVILMAQNDHPHALKDKATGELTGKFSAPASFAGMERIARMMQTAKQPPKTLSLLRWNSDVGYNSSLPHGYDLRDLLTQGT